MRRLSFASFPRKFHHILSKYVGQYVVDLDLSDLKMSNN